MDRFSSGLLDSADRALDQHKEICFVHFAHQSFRVVNTQGVQVIVNQAPEFSTLDWDRKWGGLRIALMSLTSS